MARSTMFAAMLAGAAMATAAPAWSQTAPADAPVASPATATVAEDSGQLGDIVVTAQRRETRLQDTPISITAFTAQNMTDRGITNVRDLAAFTPNLTITPGGTGGGSSIQAFIRGVGQSDYLFPQDPGVGTYVDGVYLSRTIGGLMAIVDIDRVEILKGPQGTLFGRNTIGGAINITTTKPHLNGRIEGSIEGRVGSFDRREVRASLNVPLVEDRLGLNVGVGYIKADGYGRQILTGQEQGDEDKQVVRAALRWRPASGVTFDLSGDYSRQDQHWTASTLLGLFPSTTGAIERIFNPRVAPLLNPKLGLPAGTVYDTRWITSDPRLSYGTDPTADSYHVGGVALNATWEVAPWIALHSITAWRAFDSHDAHDSDNSPYVIAAPNNRLGQHQWSEEVQAGGTTDDKRLTYLVGLYGAYEKAHADTVIKLLDGAFAATGAPPLALSQRAQTGLESHSYAIFGEATYQLVPKLEITLGARYSYDRKRYDQLFTLIDTGALIIPQRVLENHWDAFTPKATLSWKPGRGQLFYAALSQGYKSGGWNNRPTSGDVGSKPYDPEYVDNFEAGTKLSFGRNFTFNLSGFYDRYRDIQLTVFQAQPSGNFRQDITNGGRAHIYGFEADLQAVPVRGLTLQAGTGYLHDGFDSLSAGAQAAGISKAVKLPNAPSWTLNGGIQYRVPIDRVANVSARLDASYRTRVYRDIFNTPIAAQGGYELLNARIAVEPAFAPGLEVAGIVTNLTDRRYFANAVVISSFGYAEGFLGRPREWAISARYKF